TITADLDVNLDPIEAVVGDIDLPIDANLDLSGIDLGGALDGVTSSLGDTTGTLGDVTSALGDLGGTLDGVSGTIGGTTGTIGDTLGGLTDTLGGITDGLGTAPSDGSDTDLTLDLDAALPGGLPIDTITADLDVNLDPIEAVVGDIDLPIDANLDLSGIDLGGTLDGVTGTIGGTTGTIGETLGGLTDTLGGITDGLGTTPSGGSDTDLTLNLDAVLPGGLPIDTVTADLGVNLDPVEAVVGDIDLPIDVNLDLSGINLGDVTGAIGGATGALGGVTGAIGSATGALGDLGNLLTGDPSSGGTTSPDTDLTLNLDAALPGGLPIDTVTADLNVNLDPVEAVVGDIDLPIDANLDLSGIDLGGTLGDVTGAIGGATGALGGVTGALGSATGALGDLGNLLTGDPSSGGTTSPDTDLTLNLDAVLPGGLPIDTVTADLNVNLDPVEAVVGDIDLPIDANLDLSGIDFSGTLDGVTSALGDTGSSLDDITGTLGSTTGTLGDATSSLGDLGSLLSGNTSPDGTTAPDTDLTLDLDAALPGGLSIDTVTADLDVNLDPIEAVIGDIDLPINANLDLSGIDLGGTLDGVTGTLGDTSGTLSDLTTAGSDAIEDLALNLDAALDPVSAVIGEIDQQLGADLDYDTSLSIDTDLVGFITETTQTTLSSVDSGTTESQSIYDLLTDPVSLLTTSGSGSEQTSALSSLVADTSTTHILDSTTLDTTTLGSDTLTGGLLAPISNIIVGTTSDSSLSSALNSSTTSSATTSSTSGLLTQSGTSTTGSELLHLDASLSTTSSLSSGLTSSLSSTVQSLTTTANLSLDAATTTTSSITSSATTSTTATTSAIASTSASTSHATAGAGLTSLIGAVKTTTTSLLGGWHK
ncbi:MAG: hypothetical protein QM576_00945, partial [Rhodopseudomonas sp.]|uniref:beta strand repeat-containing protein n=1 Tax=Rhodopseudomonas sp. TaxID=1078 RepID=UPI0039E5139B